jgi:hypothetical protein
MNLFKGSDDCTIAGDSTMRDGKIVIGLCMGVVMLVTTSSATSALAEPSGPVELPTDMGVIELLREEVLDTVSLDQHVHFLTPETKDIVVSLSSSQPAVAKVSHLSTCAETREVREWAARISPKGTGRGGTAC